MSLVILMPQMWYAPDAAKDTELIYGFYYDTDEETVRRSLEDGTAGARQDISLLLAAGLLEPYKEEPEEGDWRVCLRF